VSEHFDFGTLQNGTASEHLPPQVHECAPISNNDRNQIALDEAHRFLGLLDPNATEFTFQTFDDNKERKDPALIRVLHGSLEERASQLIALNERGAGIFVTINETDGNGRKVENIVRVRAIWQEDDSGWSGTLPIKPSIVVESSPSKFHRYWLVDGLSEADFAAVMERMVKSFGGDKGAKDLARVLRLPGFMHQKDRPFRVRIDEGSGEICTLDRIKSTFRPVPLEQHKPKPFVPSPSANEEVARLRSALAHVSADDRITWVTVGMALKKDLGEGGRSLWDEWSKSSTKYDEFDQNYNWQSFRRQDGVGVASVFKLAMQNGWDARRTSGRLESISRTYSDMSRLEGGGSGTSGAAKANGLDTGNGAEEAKPAVDIIRGDVFLETPAPPREWLVERCVPENEVTLLAGDGGTGKSTLMLQLAVAAATGNQWLGFNVKKARVLILSAEDNKNELHFRFEKIVQADCNLSREDQIVAMKNVYFIDATADIDPTLAVYDEKSGIRPSQFYNQVKCLIAELQIDLVIVDSAADAYAQEIIRHAVKSFIRVLRMLGCTVILLAHPSVEGIRSGSGKSGSTHWHNSVRSRMYFYRKLASDGSETDPDLRILELKKANREKAGLKIPMRWKEHRFVRERGRSSDDILTQLDTESMFLELLDKFTAQGRNVGTATGTSYAPKLFSDHPDAKAKSISKEQFRVAMEVLLGVGRIKVVTEGSPSRQRSRLVRPSL
jgi:RecA-family ATPase